MPKTKAQKIKSVEDNLITLRKSETVILADFTGMTVNSLNVFRRTLGAVGATFSVVKKRLLKIIFEKEKIDFDPKKFEGQTGVVFSSKDLIETSSVVYKFSSKQKDLFKILGGFDLKEKKFIESSDIKRLGQLPSREVLLGQLAYMFGSPIKKLMFVLNEKIKKGSNQ